METFKNMHLFVQVAKASNFRRAAEVLDMPPSTVSRRIAELERDVGLRLWGPQLMDVPWLYGHRL